MKRLLCVSLAFLFAATLCGAAAACPACCACASQCQTAPKAGGEREYVEHEAIVFLKVPKDIQASEERRKLFAELCAKIAKTADAEPFYISNLYPESETGWMSVSSKTRTAKELIDSLKNDPNVLSASPNYINHLDGATKVQ